ncbi:MAG: hypothetical protein KIT79_02670 [Deltaproteobacteria bacterium]|nr:hypothetical protein [Deltaproteobacteria bacterium]
MDSGPLRKTALLLILCWQISCDGAGSGLPHRNDTLPPPNTAPVAISSEGETVRNFAYSGLLPGSDIDGPDRIFSIVSGGSLGTVEITNAATGAFTYTPAEDATGTDVFTWKLSDSLLESGVASFAVKIRHTITLRRGTLSGNPARFSVQLPPGTVNPQLNLAPAGIPGEFGCSHALVPPSRFVVACLPETDFATGPAEIAISGSGSSGPLAAGEVSVEILARATDLELTPVSGTPVKIIETVETGSRDIAITLSNDLIEDGAGPAVLRVTQMPAGVECLLSEELFEVSGTTTITCSASDGSDPGIVMVEAVAVCGATVQPEDTIEYIREIALFACPLVSSDPFADQIEITVQPEAPVLVVEPDASILELERNGSAQPVVLATTSSNSSAFFPAVAQMTSFPMGVVCEFSDNELSDENDTALLECIAEGPAVAGEVILAVTPALGPTVFTGVLVSIYEANFLLVTDVLELFPVMNSFLTGNSVATEVASGAGSGFTGPAVLTFQQVPDGVQCQFSGDGDLDNELDFDGVECTAEDDSEDGIIVVRAAAVSMETASTALRVVRLPPLMVADLSASSILAPGGITVGIDSLTDPELRYPVMVQRVTQPPGAGCTVNGGVSANILSAAGSVTLACSGLVAGNVGIRLTSANTEPVIIELSVPIELP